MLNRDKSLSENQHHKYYIPTAWDQTVEITSTALQLRGIYVLTSGILFSLIPGVGFKTVLEQLNNINSFPWMGSRSRMLTSSKWLCNSKSLGGKGFLGKGFSTQAFKHF